MPPTRPPHPRTHNADFASPPVALASLCGLPHWVNWKWQYGGRGWTKPPFCATDLRRNARTDKPDTWSPHSKAVAAVLAGKASGIGFVLTNTEIGAVDLDKCRNPETGEIEPWARAILDAAPNAYHEVTVSGEGLRVIGIATGPETHRGFSVNGREGARVEVYRRATRYITVSGFELGQCKSLPNIDQLIDDIFARHSTTEQSSDTYDDDTDAGGNGFDDIDDLIKRGAPAGQRSECFGRVVWSLAGQGLTQEAIVSLLEKHPTGIAAKYIERLSDEVKRCFTKWQQQSQSANNPPLERTAVLVRADSLTPESISWAWKNRLAFGKMAMLAGDPGLGKSTILIDVAALHSKGGEFPCGEGKAILCETVFLTAEDGLRDTLIPRLMAAEADRSKIHFLTGTKVEGAPDNTEAMFDITKDVAVLRKVFADNPAIRILIIDPLTAYLGAGTKAKENTDVRRVLTPLVKLVEEFGVLLLANNHLNKGAGKALYRILDSIAFVALGRTIHLVVEDADNREIKKFLCDKSNIGSKPLGLTYTIHKCWINGELGEQIESSRIVWGATQIDETADEALTPDEAGTTTAKGEAVEFLQILLRDGRLKVQDIQAEARAACLLGDDEGLNKSKPFRDAKEELKIVSSKDGFGRGGPWYWSLPQHANSDIGAQRRHQAPSSKNRAPMESEGAYDENKDEQGANDR